MSETLARMTETVTKYVARKGITCEIVRDRGVQTENDWEHHAYVLRLNRDGRTMETPWKQGLGIETSPTETPDQVLNSLLSDASGADLSFEDWCDEYDLDTDSRRHYATWEAIFAQTTALRTFLGEDFEYATTELERL